MSPPRFLSESEFDGFYPDENEAEDYALAEMESARDIDDCNDSD